MKKIIATQATITQDQLDVFEVEMQKVNSYLKNLSKLFNKLLTTTLNPTDFLDSLDKIIRHTQAAPTVANEDLTELLATNEVGKKCKEFAYIFLEESLEMHSRSLDEMPLWQVMLAVKIKLEGIQISEASILTYLGKQDETLSVSEQASDESKQLRASIQSKKKANPSTDHEHADNQTWDSCLGALNQLDSIYTQIPTEKQGPFKKSLNSIKTAIEGRLCSVGALEQLQQAIAYLPEQEQGFEFLCETHTQLFILIHAQIALQRMGAHSLDGSGFNVHDAKAVVRALATERGIRDIPADPYIPANWQKIQEASAENAKYFADPLLMLELICGLALLPNSLEVVTLANTSEVLDRSGDATETIILLRSKIADWAVRNMATIELSLKELIVLLTPAESRAEYANLMPAETLLLRAAALHGSEGVFNELIGMSSEGLFNFNEPIPGDPDGRSYFHFALIGGNGTILNCIFDKLNTSTRSELASSDCQHNLLHHAATSKNADAIQFLFAKDLGICVAHLQAVDGEGWTALYRAAFCGNGSGLKFLIQKYEEYNIASNFRHKTGVFSRTPHSQSLLHLAVNSGDTQTVKAVLESTAFTALPVEKKKDFFQLRSSGNLLAIDMSLMNQNTELFPLLLLALYLNLRYIDLSALTVEQVETLPDDLEIQNLYLGGAQISAAVLIKLLWKLKPKGDLDLRVFDLSALTVEQVEALPDDLEIQNLYLAVTLPVAVLIKLLGKLKPKGNLDLRVFDLSALTVEQVEALPNDLEIQNFYLGDTQIPAAVLIKLLGKLKPKKALNLKEIDLSSLTIEQVEALPDNLKVQNFYLEDTQIPAAVLIKLLGKLKPKEVIDLCEINLSDLTVEQVEALPDNLKVQNLYLGDTGMSQEVEDALRTKLCEE